MSGLREAIACQQAALSDFKQSRAASAAWSDDARRSLDAQVLDPLTNDGQVLLEQLRKAAHAIAAAQQRLAR